LKGVTKFVTLFSKVVLPISIYRTDTQTDRLTHDDSTNRRGSKASRGPSATVEFLACYNDRCDRSSSSSFICSNRLSRLLVSFLASQLIATSPLGPEHGETDDVVDLGVVVDARSGSNLVLLRPITPVAPISPGMPVAPAEMNQQRGSLGLAYVQLSCVTDVGLVCVVECYDLTELKEYYYYYYYY